MHPLQTYLCELHDIRSTGAAVKETSYYPPLANLLNAVGQTLKPRVRCVVNLKNQGAGMPDGGLFTPDQFQKGADVPLDGQPPARGAIECKGAKDDAWVTADGAQVSQYWKKYHQVLVTNYRDFVLLGQDADGRPVKLETYRLAGDEKAFWKVAAHPAASVAAQGDRFLDYLRRVMLHAAPLADPKDVAWFLASYARDARARMADADLPALNTVRKALEEALGITFEGTKKDPKQGKRSSTAFSPPGYCGIAPRRRTDGASIGRRHPSICTFPSCASCSANWPTRCSWANGNCSRCWSGRPACSTAWTATPSSPSSKTPRPYSISTSRFWKRSTRSCASSSVSGTRRRRSFAT